MYTRNEIVELIEEADITKIVAALDEKQIPKENLHHFINGVIFGSDRACFNSMFETNSFLTILLEADQAKIINLYDILLDTIKRKKNLAAIKVLEVGMANMAARQHMSLLKISCENGLTSAVRMLLPKTMSAKKQTKSGILTSDDTDLAFVEAFSTAVRLGHVEIVELFLPVIESGPYDIPNLSSMIECAKTNNPDIADLLYSLTQAETIKSKERFSKFAAKQNITAMMRMIEAGFDDVYIMDLALKTSINNGDYAVFEYLISIPLLLDYQIDLEKNEYHASALNYLAEKLQLRLQNGQVRETVKYSRIKMLNKFIEIDSNAVSNSSALIDAVCGDEVNLPAFNLLVEKTNFKNSPTSMAINYLLEKSDNATIEKIFAKLSCDAESQEGVSREVLNIVCDVFEHQIYRNHYYCQSPNKILHILQFPIVEMAMNFDYEGKVLKLLVEFSEFHKMRSSASSTIDDDIKSAKTKLKALNTHIERGVYHKPKSPKL